MAEVEFRPQLWDPFNRKWKVTVYDPPVNGFVSVDDAVACVPKPYTIIQEMIRIHECFHVAFTSRGIQDLCKKEDLSVAAFMMFEEVRIDSLAHQHDEEIHLGHDMFEEVPDLPLVEPHLPRDAGLQVLQYTGTTRDNEQLDDGVMVPREDLGPRLSKHFKFLVALLEKHGKWEEMEEMAISMWRDTTTHNQIALTRQFDKLFPTGKDSGAEQLIFVMKNSSATTTAAPSGDPRLRAIPSGCAGKIYEVNEHNLPTAQNPAWHVTSHEHIKTMQKGQLAENAAWVWTQQFVKDGNDAHAGKYKDKIEKDRALLKMQRQLNVRTTKSFGNMEVHDFVLLTNKTAAIRRPHGYAQKGEEIRQIARWWQDKRIFKSTRPGGSLVIDVSGSMNWDWAALREAINKMPSAVIGIYSGTTHGKGGLAIIAREGRWLDPVTARNKIRFASGNFVDIEVLMWLAHQRAPRVWLGDGEVHSGLVAEAQRKHQDLKEVFSQLCKKGQIVRTNKVDDALTYMQGRKESAKVFHWNSKGLLSNQRYV